MVTRLPETALHRDLAELVRSMRNAERRLFADLDSAEYDARSADGMAGKDFLAHLAAWRAVEARRMLAASGGPEVPPADPGIGAPLDETNARIHAERAGWSWEAVEADAEASADALLDAIGRSSSAVLCQCDDDIASVGVNAVNHAVAHLDDVALLFGRPEPYEAFVREVEAVLRRNHLPPRDSGVILYNVACHHALAGDLPEARRLLRDAFARRPDLLALARDDADVAALASELDALAGG
ncbi:MAG TPA: hypothetical protein VF013_08320 [Candidatus Limnocylindria bacterium]